MSEANYASAGVSYELLDAAKKLAAAQALATTGLLPARGGTGVDASRGEPAFVFELGDRSLAFVLECLGTKSIIAQQYLEAGGRTGSRTSATTRSPRSSTTCAASARCRWW